MFEIKELLLLLLLDPHYVTPAGKAVLRRKNPLMRAGAPALQVLKVARKTAFIKSKCLER